MKYQVYYTIKCKSITKAAEFLKVTIYFLNRCIREGKSCKGHSVTRKKQKDRNNVI